MEFFDNADERRVIFSVPLITADNVQMAICDHIDSRVFGVLEMEYVTDDIIFIDCGVYSELNRKRGFLFMVHSGESYDELELVAADDI